MKTRLLNDKYPKIWFLVRYGIVGSITAVIYVGCYIGTLSVAPQRSVLASAIAFVLAIAFQYVAHAKFSFATTAANQDQAGRFLTVIMCGFLISTAIAFIGPRIGWDPLAISLAAVIALPLFNLFGLCFWAFKTSSPSIH